MQKILAKIARNDDKDAFSHFFKYYYPRLIAFARQFNNTFEDSEDVVSEVMIRLLRRRKQLVKIPKLESYLYQAIKNQSHNHRRKESRSIKTTIQDAGEMNVTSRQVGPYEKVIEKELRDLVATTVNQFPPRRKIIYKMVKDDGVSIQQTAKLLEISEKTVKKHLELAMKDLRTTVIKFHQAGLRPRSSFQSV